MPSSVTSAEAVRTAASQLILNVNQFPVDVSVIRATFTRPSWPGVLADDVASARIKFNIGGENSGELSGGNIGTDGVVAMGVPKEGIVNGGGQPVPTPKAVQTAQLVVDFHEELTTAVTFEAV